MITNEILAYTAGIMDGEGSICIAKSAPSVKNGTKSPSHWLQVGIINTNRELIEWLEKTFGGHISDNSHSPSRKRQRPCWAWRVTSIQAKIFLQSIYPYLKIKKKQAKLAIEFQEKRNKISNNGKQITNKGLSIKILQEREWYKQEIAKLTLGHRTV